MYKYREHATVLSYIYICASEHFTSFPRGARTRVRKITDEEKIKIQMPKRTSFAKHEHTTLFRTALRSSASETVS